MKILGIEFNKKKPEIQASIGYQRELFSIFDGEKNPGELGALINYDLDYDGLRLRSWESYLSSEITQTVVKRFAMWVIGSGLKLQSEPITNILKESNIEVPKELIKSIESRFRIFSNSKKVDFSEKKNLHELAKTLFINKIVGGDMLVILRLEDGKINIQLVDGAMVVDPTYGEHVKAAENSGHIIKNGIEIDKRGRDIAFFVKTDTFKHERILARNPESGREVAFMVYGSEYRTSDNRGLPLFSAVLETLKKLDRYKEAVVGKVEEEAKVVMSIEHEVYSSGENPLMDNLAKSFNASGDDSLPKSLEGKALQDNVAATTNKRVVNMPNGAKLKAFESSSTSNYNDFYSPNVNSICATVGIPPEVALSKYDSNFSSARAALKDWEHTLGVERKDFSTQFYQKVYEFWLDVEVHKQNIQANGYVLALAKGDEVILASYRNARFTGANVPHIDPEKEVRAERLKLGTTGDTIPLTTSEAATEALNGGDSDANFVRYSEELKKTKELDIEAAPINMPIDNNLKKKQE